MAVKSPIDIMVPFPEVGAPQLRLALAACQLALRPGEGQAWVTGTYDDLERSLPLQIEPDGHTLRIAQRETLAESLRLEPRLAPLDLALGQGRPFGLAIEAGLLEGRLDLGGLPLTWLDLKPSQGNLEIFFAAPNPQPMQELRIFAAATRLEVRGLGNANFARLNVEGGEIDCLFDFAGTLRRPAQGEITIPKGSLEFHVPAATAACITAQTLVGAVDLGYGFTKKAGAFWNQAALDGLTPVLTLKATVLQGPIRLFSG